MKTTKKQLETFTAKIPSYLLCYLFNGDTDNLTNEEVNNTNKFLRENNCSAVDVTLYDYFSHSNDIDNLGCTVSDVVFVKNNYRP